jgi:hypothetical protein
LHDKKLRGGPLENFDAPSTTKLFKLFNTSILHNFQKSKKYLVPKASHPKVVNSTLFSSLKLKTPNNTTKILHIHN